MAKKTQGSELFYQSAADVITKVGGITSLGDLSEEAGTMPDTTLDNSERETTMRILDAEDSQEISFDFDPDSVVHQGLIALRKAGTTVTWIIGASNGAAPPTSAASVITYPTTRGYISFQGRLDKFSFSAAVNSKYEGSIGIAKLSAYTFHHKVIA